MQPTEETPGTSVSPFARWVGHDRRLATALTSCITDAGASDDQELPPGAVALLSPTWSRFASFPMRSYTLPAVVLCAVLLFSALAFGGENWPEFRGPTADGHSDAAGLPIRWSETENIKWKTAIHDKGWSSPVIWGNQIWLTTATEDGKELFALCVDRDTGTILHDIKLFDVAKPGFCPPTNSYASPTPVVEAGRVYVHFGTYGTACLDTTTGQTIWSRRDLPCDRWRAPVSSHILYGDLLVIHFDGYDQQYVVAL